jgi:hypothetical protein
MKDPRDYDDPYDLVVNFLRWGSFALLTGASAVLLLGWIMLRIF